MDIIITLPSKTDWKEYQKELDLVKDKSHVMNFKVPFLPKKADVGDKCYLCYRNKIIGWMEITGFVDGEFDCTTTGKNWEGNFIQRSGEFHHLSTKIPMKGFRGFKYVKF